MFKVYHFDSRIAGPHILILGAVHGNEIAGSIASQQIIQQIEQGQLPLKSGRVTFIPIVNESAQQQDTRFVDENLNRVVTHHKNPTTHEQKIANQLIEYIDKADVLLDLHSTHCPEDEAFAFIDYPNKKNLEFLKIIPVETALAGWPEIYKHSNAIDNFSTEEYAHTKGITALTVECGYHKAEKSINIAVQTILNTLRHYHIIMGDNPVLVDKKIIQLDSYLIKEKEGVFAKNFNHLDKINKGNPLAYYTTGEILIAPFDGVIIMPNHHADIGAEWYYLGKETL